MVRRARVEHQEEVAWPRLKQQSNKQQSNKQQTNKQQTNKQQTTPVNLAIVCGPCSVAPELRVLESGTRVASLSVRVPAGEQATSVPVTVWDPPAWIEALDAGDEVIVVGQVRRRFYSRPGGVGSRVDLEAVTVARARDRRRVDAALRRASRELDALV
jgi:single-strand DNA-binding protein